MRAPFQILAIPYKEAEGKRLYCVFHRSDLDQWQFVSGGGEDAETPLQAAQREIAEETGVTVEQIMELTSMCYIPTNIFPERYLRHWAKDTYVVPEYSFGFSCPEQIRLSREHTECVWLPYADACEKLKWDSNRTALYELHCRLEEK